MLEKQIVKKIVDMLGDLYPRAVFYKIHGGPFQAAGIPDIIGVINGRFIAIEVKQPGKEKTLTPLQRSMITRLHKAGAIAFMSTSEEHSSFRVIDGLGGKTIDPFELCDADRLVPEKKKKK